MIALFSIIKKLDSKRLALLHIANEDKPQARITVYNSGTKIEITAEDTILVFNKVLTFDIKAISFAKFSFLYIPFDFFFIKNK